jgi:aconitate hydratase
MMRGTFANVRIKNKITDKVGGFSVHLPTNETASVFDVARKYQKDNTPLVVLAGKEYGSGSSRDWAAKGTTLLGIKAVIAESFERIHRSNLVQMGILPLIFPEGETAGSLGLTGTEKYTITGIAENLVPFKKMKVRAEREDGTVVEFEAKSRLDSEIEVEYFKSGGILQYVLGDMLTKG